MRSNFHWKIVGPELDDVQQSHPLNKQQGLTNLSSAEIESELPADLQDLAQQLTDDANHLAARCQQPKLFGAPPTHGLPNWLRVAAAAVVLASVAGTGVAVGWRLGKPADGAVAANTRMIDADQTADASASADGLDSGKLRSIFSTVAAANNPAGIAEVGFNKSVPAGGARSELEMLQIQVAGFEQVIRKLQNELVRRAASQSQTEQLIESLRAEISELRRQPGDQ